MKGKENDYINPSKTILIAEDNESNFLLLDTILKKEYSIIRARNGIEAIQKFKSHFPDLILMDIKMPQMDGLEATREIRETNSDIPIIAVSAFAFPQDKQAAEAAGCSDYIVKPINCALLKRLLRYYLSPD